MAEIDREKVQARLREREEEIARRRAQLVESEDGMREGELADYDQHPADQGTETFEQQMDKTTVMVLYEELTRVHEARQALEGGTYGICAVCGKELPLARL